MWGWALKTSMFLQFLNFHPSSFFCLAQHVIFSYFSLGIYSWDFPAHLFPLPGVPDSSSNYVISIPPFHGFFQAVSVQKPSRKEGVLAVDYKDQSLEFCCVCLSQNPVQGQNGMLKTINGSFSSRYSKLQMLHLGQMKFWKAKTS